MSVMPSSLEQLLNDIKQAPSEVTFQQVMDAIAASYNYQASTFYNGLGDDALENIAGTNEGSCRIFAFAQLNNLNEEQTLHCFGDYYRKDVLDNPEGSDHGNIRTFIRDGWSGIRFEKSVLSVK